MPLLTDNTIYKEGQDTTVISSTVPSGAVGFEKDTGQTGFFVYSGSPYTLWLKNSSGVWSSHQTFTAGNLLVSSTFAWGEYEAAYLQTAVSDHVAYVYPRTGAILIDGDTSDGVNQADTLLTAGSNTGIGVTTAPIEQFPNWSSVNGHIIPDSNASFDIGSAENKVRHLFLSDNSLWLGDNDKITVADGKIRSQKRKISQIPTILQNYGVGVGSADLLDFLGGRSLGDLRPTDWLEYAKQKTGNSALTINELFNSQDFDIEADWNDYLVVDSPTLGNLELKGSTGHKIKLSELIGMQSDVATNATAITTNATDIESTQGILSTITGSTHLGFAPIIGASASAPFASLIEQVSMHGDGGDIKWYDEGASYFKSHIRSEEYNGETIIDISPDVIGSPSAIWLGQTADQCTTQIRGDLKVAGTILPNQTSKYDLGSPTHPFRDLYLSDNSLWVGDSKLDSTTGKIRKRNRIKNKVPKWLSDRGVTPADAAAAFPGYSAMSEMTMANWMTLAKQQSGGSSATPNDVFGASEDFDTDRDWEDYLVVDSPTSGDLTLSGTTGQTATLTEIRDAIDNKHTFTDHIVLKEKRDLHFYDETDSMKGQVAYNESSDGNFIKVALEADSTKTRTISLNAGNLDGASPEGTVKLVGETIINRNGAIYNVTDKLDSLDTSVVSNAAAIAAIDVTTATSFTDSNGNANFSIEQQGNPDVGVRYLKVGADTTPGHDYSGRDSVLLLQGGLPEYNSGMVMLQGKVAIRDKDQNLQITDVAASISDNTSNITTNADAILSNADAILSNADAILSNDRNYKLYPLDVAQGAANPESRMLLMSGGGTLYGKSEDITLTTDNGGGLYVNTGTTLDADLRVDGKKLSVKDTVNLLELVKAATEQANDFAHFQALMGLAFANWDPSI